VQLCEHSVSPLSLRPMVSKTSANTLLQLPYCGVTRTQNEASTGYLRSVLEDGASALNLCPFIKGHSSSAMSKHNLSPKLVVQYVPHVPRKPPSNWEGTACSILQREKKKTETDVTTQQINSKDTSSGGEQYIHNTIMAEWEKD